MDERAPEPGEGGGPPFDARFFETVFADRVRSVCAARSGTPVVFLKLADDTTLDVCHIELLTPRWMLAAVFLDDLTCENMDSVFVPYETILRVTVSTRNVSDRRMGFQLEHAGAHRGSAQA